MTAPAAAAAPPAPVFELQLSRFNVKNIVGGPGDATDRRVLPELAINHSVVVVACQHLALQAVSKFNSLTVMSAQNVSVSFDSVVSTVDVSNSSSITIVIAGVARGVNVDKSTDVTLVFDNAETARACQIVSSCATDVKVRFPSAANPAAKVECALHDKFVSQIVPDEKGWFKLATAPAPAVAAAA